MDGFKKDMERKARQIDWLKRDRERLGAAIKPVYEGESFTNKQTTEEPISPVWYAVGGVAAGGIIGYLLGSQ